MVRWEEGVKWICEDAMFWKSRWLWGRVKRGGWGGVRVSK